MGALALTVLIFAVFWLLGVGLFAALRVDLRGLRYLLAAPILGSRHCSSLCSSSAMRASPSATPRDLSRSSLIGTAIRSSGYGVRPCRGPRPRSCSQRSPICSSSVGRFSISGFTGSLTRTTTWRTTSYRRRTSASWAAHPARRQRPQHRPRLSLRTSAVARHRGAAGGRHPPSCPCRCHGPRHYEVFMPLSWR